MLSQGLEVVLGCWELSQASQQMTSVSEEVGVEVVMSEVVISVGD